MKWLIFVIVVVLFAVWLLRGRRRHPRENPEAKLVSRQRYYVDPEARNEVPPDDQQGNKL